LTRSPTNPGSHTLSIHLRSTDISPFLTWTIFLPSLTDLLATWRLTNPATHHPTQHTQLWSYITHRCLWGKNTQTSFMDYIHSPRAQALPSNTISYKNRRRWLSLQFFLFLSLSMSSYNNELDHTSDAAETHNPGQNSLLPSYSLFSLLPHSLLFSSQKQKRPYCRSLPHPIQSSLSSLHHLHCPSKNRLLIFSSSSPLPSSRSFFQFSNAVPFSPLRPQPCHLHNSSSINASRHAQFYTHHTAQKIRQPCISMQQWWGAVTTSRLMQLCLKFRIRSRLHTS